MEGKLKYSEIPVYGLEEVAKCLTVGYEKYGSGGYLNRRDAEDLEAIQRHIQEIRKGNLVDKDGFLHASAVSARAMQMCQRQKLEQMKREDNQQGVILEAKEKADSPSE